LAALEVVASVVGFLQVVASLVADTLVVDILAVDMVEVAAIQVEFVVDASQVADIYLIVYLDFDKVFLNLMLYFSLNVVIG
jgi:hypothetical protein